MDSGNVAWMLTASALVLLMTPGLAFFYGGLSRAKNVVNTIMYSFMAICVVSLVWVLWGYSLAFGTGNAFIGDLSRIGLSGGSDELIMIIFLMWLLSIIFEASNQFVFVS